MQFKPHATEECTAGACSLWLHGGNTLRGWWREKKRRRKKEKMIKGKKKVSLLHNWHFLLRVQILRLWPPVGVSWCSMHRRTCCRSILQAMHIADLSSPFKLKFIIKSQQNNKPVLLYHRSRLFIGFVHLKRVAMRGFGC